MSERVLIVENESIIAEDIQNVLEASGYCVCAIADTFENAVSAFKKENPDIIVSDIFLKGEKTGIDFAKEICKIRTTPVIFITAYSNDFIIQQMVEFHNISYITKPFTKLQLIAAVKMASKRLSIAGSLPILTNRENQIVALLIEGKNSSDIASELNISIETVKTHRKNIFLKFSVSTVSQLIVKAMNKGSF